MFFLYSGCACTSFVHDCTKFQSVHKLSELPSVILFFVVAAR